MANRTVTVLVAVGSTEYGLWCDRHALPHLARVRVVTVAPWGVSDAGTYEACDFDSPDETLPNRVDD